MFSEQRSGDGMKNGAAANHGWILITLFMVAAAGFMRFASPRWWQFGEVIVAVWLLAFVLESRNRVERLERKLDAILNQKRSAADAN